MNNPEKQQSFSDRDDDDQQKSTEDSSSVSCSTVQASPSAVSGDLSTRRNGFGLAARLTDLFVGDGDNDVDLLMQRSAQEGTVMQWLQALDMQVMGACRADERLKPLLKLNVSSGVAEDRLLTYLSQHFEPSEVGLLARCLCIPLVSIRVGKIDMQGTLLIPSSARGNLTLSLLPTSDLRISFLGDDGHVERLSTLKNISDCSSVVIEEISADNSGRSFTIKVPNAGPFYFWCSEKSRLLGNELLEKMKNLLERKPSLADLTGISDSRLERFMAHLRTYLVGSNTQVSNTALVSITCSPSATSLGLGEAGKMSQSASFASKSSRGRSCGIQGSLSPRPSSFKEGPPRNLASLKNVVRDKFRRKGEAGSLTCVENFESFSVSSPSAGTTSASNQSVKAKIHESSIETCLFPLVSGLEVDCVDKAVDSSTPQMPPIASSLFSPYYCWCPPVASTLQYTVAPPQMMPISMVESFTLPPLSSFLAGSTPRSSSGFLTQKPTLNLDEIPPFLPEPLVRLPISMPTSQQIPTFTPLITDPIVHIPVIDICSSGQAYLVSAGPAMNVTIPPLHQALVSPLIQKTDSMAEKSARETLRLLISGSSQLPSVLADANGNQNVLAAGSRGLYVGATDVNHAIANSIAAMGLVSFNERSGGVMRRCVDQGDLVDLLGEPQDSGGTCSKEDSSSFPDSGAGNGQ